MGHQFVPVHSRHFYVRDEQVTTNLRDQLGSFHPVRSELHAVSRFFQNSSDKFANTDGVVGNHHDFFAAQSVHGRGGNAGRENSGAPTAANTSHGGDGNDKNILH